MQTTLAIVFLVVMTILDKVIAIMVLRALLRSK
jgi:hypothetical protein